MSATSFGHTDERRLGDAPPARAAQPSRPMYPDLQINCMRALVTVCDLGGFRRAAEALYVTQPAISQQIKQLSRFIKTPVFTSTRQGLELSPEGKELLGYARRLVALNDETAAHFMPAQAGAQRITIGVSDQLADALPAVLKRLAATMTDAQICALTGPTESLQNEIAAGRLDLALLLNPNRVLNGSSHELGHLMMDWFGQPSVEQHDTLPVALFTEPCALRGSVIDVLARSNASWRVAYEGAELAGIRAAIQAGLGVTCLVANGDELWGLPRSADLPLPDPPAPLPVTLATHDRGSRRLATVARDALGDALSAYPFAA